MRNIGRLGGIACALFLPLFITSILMWNVVLPQVAEFICGNFDVNQTSFYLLVVVLLSASTWAAGLLSGAIVYQVVSEASEDNNRCCNS